MEITVEEKKEDVPKDSWEDEDDVKDEWDAESEPEEDKKDEVEEKTKGEFLQD